MRRRTISTLIIAAVAALAATYLLQDLFISDAPPQQARESQGPIVVTTDQPAQANVPQVAPKVFVLVPSRDLPIGTRIARTDVAWIQIPATAVKPNYVTSTTGDASQRDALVNTTYVGAFVRAPLKLRVPVPRDDLLINAGTGFLSALLPRGSVAVSIPVQPNNAVSGFILPGDRVDVIVNETVGQQKRARVLLRSVKVLAIDTTVAGATGTLRTSILPQRSITVEVSERKALVLTEARDRGQLSLLLRSVADDFLLQVAAPAEDSGEATPESILEIQDRLNQFQKPIRVIRFGIPVNVYLN